MPYRIDKAPSLNYNGPSFSSRCLRKTGPSAPIYSESNPMNLLSFLSPAEDLPVTKNQEEINKDYKYWRLRIFYSIYLGYAVFYFTRKSVTFALPFIEKDLGFTRAELGFLATVLYLSYGFSKFISSILSDQSNPRYFMAFGLILTGIINICFSFSSSILFFSLFWFMNGVAQGAGWPPCAKQLTYWFSKKERGAWWSFVTTSHNFGGGMIPLIITGVASLYNWRIAISFVGVIAIIMGFWLLNRLRDKPSTLGLPPVEVYTNDTEALKKEETSEKKKSSFRSLLTGEVLGNPGVWLLAFSYFFVYVLRTAFNDWGVFFLTDTKGYSLLSASSTITFFEIGGFLGVITAGFASDRIFKGRRLPYMVYSTILLGAALFFFVTNPTSSLILDSILMGSIGFLIFGPQLLVGLAASEFVNKQVACSANGFAGLFAYLGAAFTGWPLGKVLDLWSWNGFFITLSVCVSLNFILLALLSTKWFRPKQG